MEFPFRLASGSKDGETVCDASGQPCHGLDWKLATRIESGEVLGG